MIQFLKKSKKPYFGAILGPFRSIWAIINNGYVSVSIFQLSTNIQKITPDKNANLTDGQADRQR